MTDESNLKNWGEDKNAFPVHLQKKILEPNKTGF